jgi:hypothetical protein
MSIFDWIVFVALAALVVGGSLGVRHQWRGGYGVWRAPSWWVWGEPAFHAWRRISLVAVATIAVGNLMFLLAGLGVHESGGVAPWIVVVLTLILLSLFTLATTIAFYNRPRRLVAPHLRREPGIVDAYKNRKRRPERTRGRSF